jgi:aspartate racemase
MQLGVIGLGAYSSAYFASLLGDIAYLKVDADFEQINPYLPYDYTNIRKGILPYLEKITDMGAEQIILPNITLNLAIDHLDVPDDIRFRIVHPFKVLVDYLKKNDITSISFLATKHLMNDPRIMDFFDHHGITTEVLSDNTKRTTDELRTEVYKYGFTEENQKRLSEISYELEAPVLGCTELSVIKGPHQIDMLRLMIDAVDR